VKRTQLARKTPMSRGKGFGGQRIVMTVRDESASLSAATHDPEAARRALANRQRSIDAGSPALAPAPELSKAAPRPKHTGFHPSTRQIILDRDGMACARCGIPVDTSSVGYSLQHRDNRGMGGTRDTRINLPSNGLTLCGSGTTGCHGWTEENPTEAERLGYAVQSWADPKTVPVFALGKWYLLDNNGGKRRCLPPADYDAHSVAARKGWTE
jgi:hypothetical protein